MSFIDVCGVGNSGKGALVDLLRELNDKYFLEWSFEFGMLRFPDGFFDIALPNSNHGHTIVWNTASVYQTGSNGKSPYCR